MSKTYQSCKHAMDAKISCDRRCQTTEERITCYAEHNIHKNRQCGTTECYVSGFSAPLFTHVSDPKTNPRPTNGGFYRASVTRF